MERFCVKCCTLIQGVTLQSGIGGQGSGAGKKVGSPNPERANRHGLPVTFPMRTNPSKLGDPVEKKRVERHHLNEDKTRSMKPILTGKRWGRKGTLYAGGAMLLVGVLYYVFLYPQYPFYENLPEYPSPPPRDENAFYDYYEAASTIQPDENDFMKASRALIEFASAGFPLSATLPAFSAEMNEKCKDALDHFREGTTRENCHVYLEYYDLEIEKMRATGALRRPGGTFSGLLLRTSEEIEDYPEREWIKEGHRSTELRGEVTQSLLLLAFVDAVNAMVIADASGTASAAPHFGDVLR